MNENTIRLICNVKMNGEYLDFEKDISDNFVVSGKFEQEFDLNEVREELDKNFGILTFPEFNSFVFYRNLKLNISDGFGFLIDLEIDDYRQISNRRYVSEKVKDLTDEIFNRIEKRLRKSFVILENNPNALFDKDFNIEDLEIERKIENL